MAPGDTQALAERLRERRDEIERALLTRVWAISDPAEVGDPEYALGLRSATTAALDYALDSLGQGEAATPALAEELPAQARAAARAGVGLDIVLRRYLAGYTLLSDRLVAEAQEGHDLAATMRAQAELFDRLIASVTAAYTAESRQPLETTERRRAEKVRRLLRGELVDALDLGYPLGAWHLGVAALGVDAVGVLRDLAEALDRRLLLVKPGGERIWAWLGGERRLAAGWAAAALLAAERPDVRLAIGEPARGLAGWQLTHRQALTALPVAVRGNEQFVSYSDVAILAAALGDEVLTSSLHEAYVAPLVRERDGGATLRDTLRAYFGTGRNVVSAAASLGVSRQTVANRLKVVEERIGKKLEACGAELETSLRLWELNGASDLLSHHVSPPRHVVKARRTLPR